MYPSGSLEQTLGTTGVEKPTFMHRARFEPNVVAFQRLYTGLGLSGREIDMVLIESCLNRRNQKKKLLKYSLLCTNITDRKLLRIVVPSSSGSRYHSRGGRWGMLCKGVRDVRFPWAYGVKFLREEYAKIPRTLEYHIRGPRIPPSPQKKFSVYLSA